MEGWVGGWVPGGWINEEPFMPFILTNYRGRVVGEEGIDERITMGWTDQDPFKP